MPLVAIRPASPVPADPLVTYTVLASRLIAEHNLPGWSFRLDNARRRAGVCRHGPKLIQLSKHYILRNLDRPDDLRDTILHEIAHAIAGHKAGHGDDWKAVCMQIGARPERCYDSVVIDMPKGRYAAVCKGCMKVFRRHKQVKKNTYRYCIPCGTDTGRLTFTTTITSK